MIKNIALLLLFVAVIASGCTTQRQEALERRQDGYDTRHDARMKRQETRSNRADERYGW